MQKISNVAIDTYIRVISGFAFQSERFSPKNGIPLIRIRNLLEHKPETYYSGPYDSVYLVNKGNILIGMDGDFNVVKWRGATGLLNQRICRISSKSEQLHESYLFHWLQPKIDEIHRRTPQTTVRHLSTKDIESISFFFFPLNEQLRISEILDTIDEAIQKTEARILKLKAIKQGLLHDLLTRGLDKNGKLRDHKAHPEQFKDSPLGNISSSWRVQKLQSFYDEPSVNGLYKPKKYYGHGPLMIHMPQMFRGLIIDTSDAARVEVNSTEIDRYGLRNGDLVFARRSLNLEGAGRCALVNDLTQTTTFESSIIRVRIRQEELLPEFVNYFLNSAIGFKLRLPLIRQVAVSGVSSGDIASIPIPCPSISEQERIIQVIEAHISRIRNEEQYRDKLKLQKKGLMHDLLTGKVRVRL